MSNATSSGYWNIKDDDEKFSLSKKKSDFLGIEAVKK